MRPFEELDDDVPLLLAYLWSIITWRESNKGKDLAQLPRIMSNGSNLTLFQEVEQQKWRRKSLANWWKSRGCSTLEYIQWGWARPKRKDKTNNNLWSEIDSGQTTPNAIQTKEVKNPNNVPPSLARKVICSKCKAKDSVTATRSSFLCKQCG